MEAGTLDEDKLVGCIMVDLSKAFDMVSHMVLLRRLANYGVKAAKLLYFNGRRQTVHIDGNES